MLPHYNEARLHPCGGSKNAIKGISCDDDSPTLHIYKLRHGLDLLCENPTGFALFHLKQLIGNVVVNDVDYIQLRSRYFG